MTAPPSSAPDAGDDPRVVAWAAHLRGGGSVPWREFLAAQPAVEPGGGTVEPSARLPRLGAAQLEVARRLAAAAPTHDARFAALVDRALSRSGPGRGPAELPLVGARRPAYGPAPVDPAELGVEELLRHAVGLLADLVEESDPTVRRAPEPSWAGSLGLRRRSYRLFGSPELVRAARASLADAGRPEGGRHQHVVMLLQPLETALVDLWTTRVRRGADVGWSRFARGWTPGRQLPPPWDVARLAAHWRGARMTGRFHVVVALGAEQARDHLARVLRVPAARLDVPAVATPAEVDALRRLNRVLGLRLEPQVHRSLIEALSSVVLGRAEDRATADPDSLSLQVPASTRPRLERAASEVRNQVLSGGYAVRGDVADLAARTRGGVADPDPQRTLQVAVTACLRVAGIA